MVFLADVFVPCEACGGSRYRREVLDVKIHGHSVHDVLQWTVEEAIARFRHQPKLGTALWHLQQVGLGYLRLGQPATELSGGEAQRIKLATELQRTARGDTLYVLDEPTTGLHPVDVERLVVQLNGLVDAGNTAVVVEHDVSVAAQSDWVIEVGPGAGEEGGRLVQEGTPSTYISPRRPRSRPM
jgi:excinuclease ABC subunit A